MAKYPQVLAWVDTETTGLPDGNDFSEVYPLEVSVILTDFDLNKLEGYTSVIKMTDAAAEKIRGNSYVFDMHKKNGLLKESVSATSSQSDVESELIEFFRTAVSFEKGEFALAGSGVASFDFPMIKQQFPLWSKWFAYYPYDSGIFRRILKLAARDFDVPTVSKSSGDDKSHRSLEDVNAHIEEMRGFQDWFKTLKEMTSG